VRTFERAAHAARRRRCVARCSDKVRHCAVRTGDRAHGNSIRT